MPADQLGITIKSYELMSSTKKPKVMKKMNNSLILQRPFLRGSSLQPHYVK